MIIAALSLPVALLLFVSGFFVSVEPVGGGGLTLEGWWLSMLGVAILPLSKCKTWGCEAALSASALIVSSCAWLTLTKPLWLNEFYLRPHNFRDWGHRLALLVIVLHSFFVVFGLWRRRGDCPGVFRFVRRPQTIIVGAIFLLVAGAQFTLFYPHLHERSFQLHFVAQMLASVVMAASVIGNLILFYLALDGGWAANASATLAARFSFPWSEREGSWDPMVSSLLGIFVFLTTAGLALFAFDRLPHIPDGLAYIFQAKCIAAGSFVLEELPASESFELYLIDHRDGISFSITNPGWPMILALGESMGLAWLVNPILAALALLLSHRFLRRIATVGWANLLCLLLAISPWFLFLGASHMTHMATMVFFLGGLLAVWTAQDRCRSDMAFFGGLCFGVVFLIRPLDGLLLGGGAGFFLLWKSWQNRRKRLLLPLSFSAAAILISSILLVFNESITGDYFSTPTNTYIAERWPHSSNRLGFGSEVGNPPEKWGLLDPIPGHSWQDVLLNSNQNLANMNLELFGWPSGSLILLALFFLLRRKPAVLDRVALVSVVVLALGYNLYWFSGGPDFGPRYWFSMFLPVLWLSGRGLTALVETLEENDEAAAARMWALVSTMALISLLVFVSWRCVAKYHDYRGFHSDYRRMMEAGVFGSSVVFVDTPQEVDYGCAFLLNTFPIRKDSPIFVRDLGIAGNARVMRAYSGRSAVFVDGRAKTGQVARIRPR